MSTSKIREVAGFAKVSIATVSRVLNNSSSVRDETRARVLEAISALDYHPNMLGYNLRQSSSGIIVLLANTVSKPFYVSFMDTIQRAAADNNYSILLGQYGDDLDKFDSYIRLVQNKLADGLILVNHNQNIPHLDDIAQKIPIIQCCEHYENSTIPFVSVDDYKCAQYAVEHLISCGRKRIGFFNYSLSANFARRCHAGFIDTLKKAGLTPNPQWMVTVPSMDFEPVFEAALKFLKLPDRPDAIFTEVDMFGPALLKAANLQGIRVPQDLSVASGDNSFLSEITCPSLTAVDHRREEMAKAAFELLLERINNEPVKHSNIVIDPQLIVRESSI